MTALCFDIQAADSSLAPKGHAVVHDHRTTLAKICREAEAASPEGDIVYAASAAFSVWVHTPARTGSLEPPVRAGSACLSVVTNDTPPFLKLRPQFAGTSIWNLTSGEPVKLPRDAAIFAQAAVGVMGRRMNVRIERLALNQRAARIDRKQLRAAAAKSYGASPAMRKRIILALFASAAGFRIGSEVLGDVECPFTPDELADELRRAVEQQDPLVLRAVTIANNAGVSDKDQTQLWLQSNRYLRTLAGRRQLDRVAAALAKRGSLSGKAVNDVLRGKAKVKG